MSFSNSGALVRFLLPVFLGMLGIRWFRSRAVQTPIAKTLGGAWLLMFVPALLAILPGHFRWMGEIPVEGLLGRVVGDALIHYFNVAGAYIVCTTFSRGRAVLDYGFFLSLRSKFGRPRASPSFLLFGTAIATGRTNAGADAKQLELDRRPRAKKTTRPYPTGVRPAHGGTSGAHAGVRLCTKPTLQQPRLAELVSSAWQKKKPVAFVAPPLEPVASSTAGIEVTDRADNQLKSRTTLPKIAGSYKAAALEPAAPP